MSSRIRGDRPSPARGAFRLVLAAGVGLAAAGTAMVAASASAGAGTTLGGFTVSAIASGMTASYEQPNLPIPATPTAELNVGFSSTSYNFGPSGNATASSVYPGQVAANAGPQLALLLPGVPLPPVGAWPAQATSTCPGGPNATNNMTPGTVMEATCGADSNTASASFGTPGSSTTDASPPSSGGGAPGLAPIVALGAAFGSGSAPSPAASSAIFSMQGLSSTTTSGAIGPIATASATSNASRILILGGLITIGSVNSTATAISDGITGILSGSSTAQNVVVAGQPATVDSSGVHAADNSSPPNPASPTVQQVLAAAGITMTLTNPTDTTTGPHASRQLDGLRMQIDLTKLDEASNTLAKLIPASVLANLPLPLPDKQILVLDFGWLNVNSAASPAFIFNGDQSASTDTSGGVAGLGLSGSIGTFGTSSSPFGDGGGLGGSNLPGTGAPSGPGDASPLDGASAFASAPIFKGINGGFLAFGLLLAAGLGFAYLRAQSIIEAVAGGLACPTGGTPLTGGGFGEGPQSATDDLFGGDPLYRDIDMSLPGA